MNSAYPKEIDNSTTVHFHTDEAFLDVCDARITRFYNLWRSKFKGDRLPRRSDFDPIEMIQLLPYIYMVDKQTPTGDYRYRLVGTNDVLVRRMDPTGKLVKDYYTGENLQDALKNYDYVFNERNFVYDLSIIKMGGPLFYRDQFLMVPTSSDGVTVDIVVGIAVQDGFE